MDDYPTVRCSGCARPIENAPAPPRRHMLAFHDDEECWNRFWAQTPNVDPADCDILCGARVAVARDNAEKESEPDACTEEFAGSVGRA